MQQNSSGHGLPQDAAKGSLSYPSQPYCPSDISTMPHNYVGETRKYGGIHQQPILHRGQSVVEHHHENGAHYHPQRQLVDANYPSTLSNSEINYAPRQHASQECVGTVSKDLMMAMPQETSNPPLCYSQQPRKRPSPASEVDNRPQKSEKSSKGLRHFSMKVCEKVQQKKITTYNEVADELVREFGESEKGPGNEQNIRRRVYDALNVLMAMNIISKDKKEIRWLGLPSNSAQEHQRLQEEGAKMYESLKEKLKKIYELITQQISLHNLILYNKHVEEDHGAPMDPSTCIQLPFLSISTAKSTDVVCRISEKKDKYDISFSSDFEIHDDSEILRRLNLHSNLDSPNCSPEDVERALALVPPNLANFVRAMAGRSVTEFQNHILNNRCYLNEDNTTAQFYDRVGKTARECKENSPKSDSHFWVEEIKKQPVSTGCDTIPNKTAGQSVCVAPPFSRPIDRPHFKVDSEPIATMADLSAYYGRPEQLQSFKDDRRRPYFEPSFITNLKSRKTPTTTGTPSDPENNSTESCSMHSDGSCL